MKKVYVSQTKNNGKGLFAREKIREDKIIFVVGGEIKRCIYLPLLSWLGKRWFGIDKNIWIKTKKDNPIYFMNHSCNPNAKVENKVEILAIKNIEKWKEITIDYALIEGDPYWKMKCKCGSANCRKVIYGEAK